MIRRVSIISYGTGNLASLTHSLGALGATCKVVDTAADLAHSEALILPGVGHFGQAINFFRASGLLGPALERIQAGTPTLGICLGFQLLTQASEESRADPGLKIFPCSAVRIRPSDPKRHKVPHIGWNSLDNAHGFPRLLQGIPNEQRTFYFANAYAVNEDREFALPHATFSHGSDYLALIENKTVFGVQFHPEKSGGQGLHLLKNFLET